MHTINIKPQTCLKYMTHRDNRTLYIPTVHAVRAVTDLQRLVDSDAQNKQGTPPRHWRDLLLYKF